MRCNESVTDNRICSFTNQLLGEPNRTWVLSECYDACHFFMPVKNSGQRLGRISISYGRFVNTRSFLYFITLVVFLTMRKTVVLNAYISISKK